jgi:hypothetical protein
MALFPECDRKAVFVPLKRRRAAIGRKIKNGSQVHGVSIGYFDDAAAIVPRVRKQDRGAAKIPVLSPRIFR